MKVSKNELRKKFRYDPDTGDLIRRIGCKGYEEGTVIGTTKPSGYKVAVVNGKSYRLHKLVWVYHYGNTELEIDHKNRNRGDNRIENLRLCSRADNVRHSSAKSPGYKGVSFCKQTKRWVAQITVDYRNKKLGRFNTPEEAARVYNAAAIKYFGEFAYLNEIGQ